MPFDFPNQSFPTSYQPVLNEDFLSSLYANINDQEQRDIGSAQGEAVSRGLTGTPFEAGAVGSARTGANRSRQQTLSDFLFNLAGMRQQENIIGEQQAYGTSERLGRQAFEGQLQTDRERAQMNQIGAEFGYKKQLQDDPFNLYAGLAQGVGQGIGKLPFLGG